MRRRTAIKWLTTTATLSAMPMTWSMHHRHIERPGLQLYTLREAMSKDASAALVAVARAGYMEVETAGTGNLSALQFAQALKDTGLTSPAAHVPINLVRDQPDELLKLADTVGHQYLVVPWLPPEMRTPAGYASTIDTLNTFGAMSAREGVQLAYHNHDFEFAVVDGQVVFDRMLENCDATTVKFELDLYWAAHAGADAANYLKSDPARYPLCHVKDRANNGDMVDVGDGEIDFPLMFQAGSGLQHYFVEHDRPSDPMTSIQRSVAALKQMRF